MRLNNQSISIVDHCNICVCRLPCYQTFPPIPKYGCFCIKSHSISLCSYTGTYNKYDSANSGNRYFLRFFVKKNINFLTAIGKHLGMDIIEWWNIIIMLLYKETLLLAPDWHILHYNEWVVCGLLGSLRIDSKFIFVQSGEGLYMHFIRKTSTWKTFHCSNEDCRQDTGCVIMTVCMHLEFTMIYLPFDNCFCCSCR
jgi:hypothetical protein